MPGFVVRHSLHPVCLSIHGKYRHFLSLIPFLLCGLAISADSQTSDSKILKEDESYIAAEKAFAEGDRLYLQWEEESLKKAIQKYSDARRLYRSADCMPEEAVALESIGDAYFILSQYQKALDYYEEALDTRTSANSTAREISALNKIGYAQIHLGNYQDAINNGTRAHQLSLETGNRTSEAQSLNLLGTISYRAGDSDKALDRFSRALNILESLPDNYEKIRTLIYLGYTYNDMGDRQKALEYLRQGMSISERINYLLGKAQIIASIGMINNLQGEIQKALDLHFEAMALFRRMGNREGEARTYNNLGATHEQLGDIRKALEYYTQAKEIYRDTGNFHSEAGTTDYIGKIYLELGDYPKALDLFNQALFRTRAINDKIMEGVVLNDLGAVHSALGDKQKALSYFNQALRCNLESDARREQVYTLNRIGRTLEDIGENQKALDLYRQALPLSQKVEDRRAETRTLYNIARFEFKNRNFTNALTTLNQSLQIIESLRTKVAGQDFRSSYFESVRPHYDLYIDLLMRMHEQDPSQGMATAALEASEKARARTLIEILAEAGIDIREGVAPSLLEKEQSIENLLKAKAMQQMELLGGPHSREEAEAIAKELDALSTQYDETQSLIRGSSPRYAVLMQPEPLRLPAIRKEVLDADTLLLEYALGEERSYLWAITQTSFDSFILPGKEEIERACGLVREHLMTRLQAGNNTSGDQARLNAADAEFWLKAEALSHMLLNPVADLLGQKRLIVVAEGALQYIPFSVLPKPGIKKDLKNTTEMEMVPMIVDHEIVSLPSASFLAILRKETGNRPSTPKTLAVLADPVFEPDDPRVVRNRASRTKSSTAVQPQTSEVPDSTAAGRPRSSLPMPDSFSEVPSTSRDMVMLRDGLNIPRLPGTLKEAEAIRALKPTGEYKIALNFDASLATATSPELSLYRIIHFATHGLLNDRHPGLSSLVLSTVDKQGQPQDGFLRLSDIYKLRLSADLVVLSACNSGLGEDVRGEALMGIVRGFMYAGAARVVASLWKVDDQATSELMKRFYYNMLTLGETPAAALRSAQVKMWEQEQWRFPFYWAAFVLQGEWK